MQAWFSILCFEIEYGQPVSRSKVAFSTMGISPLPLSCGIFWDQRKYSDETAVATLACTANHYSAGAAAPCNKLPGICQINQCC